MRTILRELRLNAAEITLKDICVITVGLIVITAVSIAIQDCWKDCPGGWQVPCDQDCPTENVPPGACPGDKGCPGNQQQ